MSNESANSLSVTAGAVVSLSRFLKVGAVAGKMIHCAGAEDDAVGVSMEAAAADLDIIAMAKYDGAIVEIESGAAIDISSTAKPLTSDATGRAIEATGTARVMAYALQSAGAAGEFIRCILVPQGLKLVAAQSTAIYDHADDVGTNAAIAAAAVARSVFVFHEITETLAATTVKPIFTVGYTGSVTAFANIITGAAGLQGFTTGSLPADLALNVYVTDGTGGAEAGKVQVAVFASV